MILAKNFSAFFSENLILAILLLSVFCVCAISIVFLVLFAWIKSRIYNHINNIFKTISAINAFSIRSYFTVVERISIKDASTTNRVAAWRKSIKKIHNIELVRVFRDLKKFLIDPHSFKPSFLNVNRYQSIDKQLMKIYKNSFEILQEMNVFLAEEFAFRNRTIQLKSFFDDLKDNLWTLYTAHNEIKYEKIENLINDVQISINNLIVDTYDIEYDSALKQVKDLDDDLLNIIILLDKVPSLFSKVNHLIPSKIQELKNKYQQNHLQEHTSAIVSKIIELEQEVGEKNSHIKAKLKNLLFRDAAFEIDKLLMKIKAVKNSIEFGDRLYNLLSNNLEDLTKKVNLLDEVLINLEKQFHTSLVLQKNFTEEQKFKEKVKIQVMKNYEQTLYLVSNFKNDKESFTKEKLSQYKQRFITVISEIIDSALSLEKLNKVTEKYAISSDKITTSLVYAQSLIAQCEIKIKTKSAQNKNLENFLPLVVNLNQEAEQLIFLAKNELDKNITADELHKKISDLNLMTEELNTNINNEIFLDYISQELIIYLERFVAHTPKVDEAVNNLEKLFSTRQYDQLIGYWISVMNNLSQAQRR